jgi:hypothetical protein
MPPRVAEDLVVYRSLVEVNDRVRVGFRPAVPERYTLCPKHTVIEHELGCIVCNDE